MKEEHLWKRVPVVPDDITTSVGGFAAVCSCGAKTEIHSTFTDLYREMNEHTEGRES